jgi:VCBS repeat-containing protein
VVLCLGVAACGGKDIESSLAGTWDVISTRVSSGSKNIGTLTWNESSSVVTVEHSTMTFTLNGAAGTVTLKDSNSTDSILIQHTSGAGDPGSLGVNPFGSWVFTNYKGGDSCTATLSPESFTNVCAGESDSWTAQHTATKDSIFGDLGGDWTFTAGSDTCTGHLVGSTFSASCGHTGGSQDTVTLTVNGTMLSGTTSDGYELSGTKR